MFHVGSKLIVFNTPETERVRSLFSIPLSMLGDTVVVLDSRPSIYRDIEYIGVEYPRNGRTWSMPLCMVRPVGGSKQEEILIAVQYGRA